MFVGMRPSLFLAALACLSAYATAQAAKGSLKPASAVPTSKDVTVQINQSYTSDMAWQANLDIQKPQLSTNGFSSTWGEEANSGSKLASAECLLAETILAAPFSKTGLAAGDVISLCKGNMVAPDSAPSPAIRVEGKLPNGSGQSASSPSIDYALIHVVQWTMPPSSGGVATGTPQPKATWYLFQRNTTLVKGQIVPWKAISGVSSLSTGAHLLGNKNVAFLAVHLGIDATCKISYDVNATHTTPLNRQDVQGLIQIAESVLGKSTSSTAGATKGAAGITPPSQAPAAPSPVTIVGIWGGQIILGLDNLPESIAFTPSTGGTVRAYQSDVTKDPRSNSNQTADSSDHIDASVVATCSPAPKQAVENSTNSDSSTSANENPETNSPGQSTSSAQPSTSGSGGNGSKPADASAVENPQGSTPGPSKNSTKPPSNGSGGNGSKDANASTSKNPQTNPPGKSTNSAQPSTNGSAANGSKDPLAGMSQTIPDEGPHHWDVSVAFPVTSYNSIKFDSTNNLLVPKSTTSVNPYALFDWYMDPIDLAASTSKFSISMPYLAFGVPIGNQPLQKPFFGGGFIATIKSIRFQPVVGLHVQDEVRPDSSTSTATHREWHSNLQVQIGFSIKDAMKVLGITASKN